MKRLIIPAVIVAAIATSPAIASAAGGVIAGRMLFYQNNQDYCPSTQNCDAANYVEAQYQTYQPLAELKVYVEDEAGTILGQSSTSVGGDFRIAWYRGTAPSSVRLFWRGEHKDGRFHLRTASGARFRSVTSYFAPVVGTTSASPQRRGDIRFGSATNPPAYANLYDGAWRMWHFALSYSNRMHALFTDVEIRAFGNDDSCPTSCAGGKQVSIDSNSTFVLSDRILHELGHIASELSHPWSTAADYCRDEPGSTQCGWSYQTAEWRSRSFEEGLATFLGDVAQFWFWAPDPTIGGTSREVNTACSTNESRWAQAMFQYLWDAYDDHADAGWDDADNVAYYAFIDTLASYCDGSGDHCASEGVANRDGRSASDFAYQMFELTGAHTTRERINNCVE